MPQLEISSKQVSISQVSKVYSIELSTREQLTLSKVEIIDTVIHENVGKTIQYVERVGFSGKSNFCGRLILGHIWRKYNVKYILSAPKNISLILS